MKRKITLNLILTALVCLLLSVSAGAVSPVASGECGANGNNLIWTLDSTGLLTITGEGEMADCSYYDEQPWTDYRSQIKSVIIGDSVTSIGDYAFYWCSKLCTVDIGDSVTIIGYRAFDYCFALTSVDIPNSVTIIGDYAFDYCTSLTSVVIPDSVTHIGEHAFYTCSSLASVDIGDSVTSIGVCAFADCDALTTVVIPDSVTHIGDDAFYGCYSLASVNIGNSVTSIEFWAFANCPSLTAVTFTGNAPTIGNNIFYGVTATVYYPANDATWTKDVRQNYGGTIDWVVVEIIASGECGANGDNLTWTLDENGLLTITGEGEMVRFYSPVKLEDGSKITSAWGGYAAQIKSVVIGDGVTSVGVQAFAGCPAITSVSFGDDMAIIGYNAFTDCIALEEVVLPASVTQLGTSAFRYCTSLKKVTFEGGAPDILPYNNTVTPPFDRVTATAYYPANDSTWTEQVRQNYGSTLTWVAVGDSDEPENPEIIASGECGVNGDNLTWILDSNGVLTVSGEGAMASYRSNIGRDAPWYEYAEEVRKVVFGSGVTEIGEYAFNGCKNCTEVIIPDGVEVIGGGAFINCVALTTVRIPASVEQLSFSGSFGFRYCDSLESFTVDAANPNYCAVDGVLFSKDMKTIIKYPEGKATAVYTVPAGVTAIGKESFYCCDNLITLYLPASVETVTGNPFYNSLKLEDIVADPAGTYVCSVDGVLFSKDMSRLIYYPAAAREGETYIVPEGVTKLEYASFRRAAITRLQLPESLKEITYSALEYSALQYVVIPGDMVSIGSNTFNGCTKLEEIVFTGDAPSVDGIHQSAFQNVTTTVYYPANNATWTEEVRQNYGGTLTWVAVGEPEGPEIIASGECGANGDNLTWTLDSDGVLTISGAGAMAEYALYSELPWYDYCLSIVRVNLPDGITNICDSAFAYCESLTDITIPDSVTSIGSSAFCYCIAIKSIEIPSSVTSIGEYAFYLCEGLTDISLPTNITAITDGMFGSCYSLVDLEIPDSVTSIGYLAFRDCGALSCIEIPDSVTNIGDYSFRGCISLQSIEIPSSVISIGDYAFDIGSSLTSITFEGNPPSSVSSSAFSNVTATVYYPANNATWTDEVRQDYGGRLTWVAVGGSEIPNTPGKEIEITVNKPANSNINATVTAPVGGWKEGTNTFTVSSEKTCHVFISRDGGQTYERVTATTAGGEHAFTAKDMTAETVLEVVVAGDINGDGDISAADISKLLAISLGKTTASGVYNMITDVNEDGQITAADISKLLAASLGKTSLSW